MKQHRLGIAIYTVLLVMVAMYLMIFSMIHTSGQMRGASADMRQKLHARLAAEGAVAIAQADIVQVGNDIFYIPKGYTFPTKTFVVGKDTGTATSILTDSGLVGPVTSGPMTGLNGIIYGVKITAQGTAMGRGKAPYALELDLLQVPIFQYGQFSETNLNVGAGSNLSVFGPVHANGDLKLTASGAAIVTLQGPITASGSICWGGTGTIKIYRKPTVSASPWSETGLPACSGPGSGPPPTGSYSPLSAYSGAVTLPVDGSLGLWDLLQLSNPSDPLNLRRQKFDWLVQDPTKASVKSRFIAPNTGVALPAWITGPYRYFHRANWAWCKYWKVDVGAMLAATGDSLFYFADTFHITDKGSLHNTVINAFVLTNGATLSRNVSLTSPNIMIVVGDYNTGATTRNAMVAGPMIYHASSSWILPAYDAKFGRNLFTVTPWVEPLYRTYQNIVPRCTDAALSRKNCFINIYGYVPPNTTQISSFLGVTQNIFEDWANSANPSPPGGIRTLTLTGSRVSPSTTYYIGSENPQLLSEWNLLAFDPAANQAQYATPPLRNFSFDVRLTDLKNMPPFTPYMAAVNQTEWREGQ